MFQYQFKQDIISCRPTWQYIYIFLFIDVIEDINAPMFPNTRLLFNKSKMLSLETSARSLQGLASQHLNTVFHVLIMSRLLCAQTVRSGFLIEVIGQINSQLKQAYKYGFSIKKHTIENTIKHYLKKYKISNTVYLSTRYLTLQVVSRGCTKNYRCCHCFPLPFTGIILKASVWR